MYKTNDKLHTITCDKCSKTESSENDSPGNDFFNRGWGIAGKGKKYQHLCFDCLSPEQKKNWKDLNNRINPEVAGPEIIRALSWKQPYASLMLHGKIETRTWSTDYRGKVLICASKALYNYNQILDISGEKQVYRIFEQLKNDKFYYKNLTGVAIAVADLVDCRKMEPADEDACFVQYKEELYCHMYTNIQPIVPMPWAGTQGWSTLNQDVIKNIRYL